MYSKLNFILSIFIVILLLPIIYLYFSQTQELDKHNSNLSLVKNTIDTSRLTNLRKETSFAATETNSSNLPTLEQLRYCEPGLVEEPPLALNLAKYQRKAYGTLEIKRGNNLIAIQDYFDNKLVNTDIGNVRTIYFYMIYNREDYLNRENYEYIQTANGNPYYIDEIYDKLPIGIHIWAWEGSGYDSIAIYCPIDKNIL